MITSKIIQPLILIILDGFGYNKISKNNAIALANTPQLTKWQQTGQHILLEASGDSVGLPDNQMGNSEVGHMHIGAGRMINQDFTKINQDINTGNFFTNQTIINTINQLKENNKFLHIIGLLSNGGVHSHQEHLFALLKICYLQKFTKIILHLFFDGRDTAPQSALKSLNQLQQQLNNMTINDQHIAKIGSISGRYFAMDRDKRFERTASAYELITSATSLYHFDNVETAITYFHEQKIYDEFFPPTSINDQKPIQDGDAILFFNFRSDRTRQLTQAFIDKNFTDFTRSHIPQLSAFITMTQYADFLPTTVLFPPLKLTNTLGEIIARHGLKQLRIAETEKYAHVTFFFNGGQEQPFLNETRLMIDSPKVATYDLLPQMSAEQITDNIIHAINNNLYDIIICNYANADMVGHTGNLAATITAIECLDQCLTKIAHALNKFNHTQGALLITADHGNAELMFDETTAQIHTAHTTSQVPLLFVGHGWHFIKQHGTLIDIAPTILKLLNINIPQEMTGTALLQPNNIHENIL